MRKTELRQGRLTEVVALPTARAVPEGSGMDELAEDILFTNVSDRDRVRSQRHKETEDEHGRQAGN